MDDKIIVSKMISLIDKIENYISCMGDGNTGSANAKRAA